MDNFLRLKEDFWEWLGFLIWYGQKKIKIFTSSFESSKGSLVDFLINKRGLRQRPFLHFGMLALFSLGILGAPFVASTYPTLSQQKPSVSPPSAVLNIQTAAETETVTEESVKPRDKIIPHKVQKGETLSSIAEKYGISTDTIRWANDLKSIHDLSIGQELKILPVTGVAHTVKKGETIYIIAKKYSANPQAIVDFPFNDFIDPSAFTLAVDTTIIVPDGTKPAEIPWSPPKPTSNPIFTGGSGQFAWPTSGSITQGFSWYHPGIDIANSSAPTVVAADGGTVVLAEKGRWGYGWYIIIDHGNGYQTLYAHLQGFYVSVGDRVSRGQAIGQMGSTGRSTGTHAHFEIRVNGKAQSPRSYLK